MTTRDDTIDLRQRIAEALMCWAEQHNNPRYASMRRPETVTRNAYDRADAVLAVLAAPSPLRVRSAGVRMTHEAVRTRFGVLLPVCGTSLRGATSAPAGSPVTCPFCNGTEKPTEETP